MALIVLHRAGNSHEATLDQDVTHMGNHYGNVVHVLQAEIANYQFPNTDGEQTIHILTHGAVNHACNMQATDFNAWMLKAFQMSKYPQAVQTYFIYSCDVATGAKIYWLVSRIMRLCRKLRIGHFWARQEKTVSLIRTRDPVRC